MRIRAYGYPRPSPCLAALSHTWIYRSRGGESWLDFMVHCQATEHAAPRNGTWTAGHRHRDAKYRY